MTAFDKKRRAYLHNKLHHYIPRTRGMPTIYCLAILIIDVSAMMEVKASLLSFCTGSSVPSKENSDLVSCLCHLPVHSKVMS